jgi:pyruvate/2-oxoglutarate dehydrogenase complex dihydrolipoamide dehydrogenase (E3) component
VRGAARFGTIVKDATIDMARVRGRKQEMIDREIELHLSAYRDSGAELIMGNGRFSAPKTIEVTLNTGGTRLLTGKEIVLNVGSRAAIPDTPGLREANPLTHIEALELNEVPPHLIVLGGGYTGVEMAQAFVRFGSRVTIIEAGPRIMGREDADVSDEMATLLQDEGTNILTNTRAMRVAGLSGDTVTVTAQTDGAEQQIRGSHVLVAAGRIANTADIGLDAAGVKVDSRGFVEVDERLKTTTDGVWAIGECAGSPQFTHVSVDDFRIVRDNMAGQHHTTKGRLVPHVMFTDPPLARVGLSESEARYGGISVRIAKLPVRRVLRTLATDEARGFMKVLVSAKDDRILGFAMIGSEAGEVMAVIQTAMLADLPYTKLRDAVFAHRSMAEGLGPLFENVPRRELLPSDL